MRKLSLNKEVLRNLDVRGLRKVGGGQPQLTPVVNTLPLNDCIAVRTLQGCTTAVDCP